MVIWTALTPSTDTMNRESDIHLCGFSPALTKSAVLVAHAPASSWLIRWLIDWLFFPREDEKSINRSVSCWNCAHLSASGDQLWWAGDEAISDFLDRFTDFFLLSPFRRKELLLTLALSEEELPCLEETHCPQNSKLVWQTIIFVQTHTHTLTSFPFDDLYQRDNS